MKQQTAVEWFKKHFYTYAESRGLDNDQWLIDEQDLSKIIEQAKALEKEQIIDAFKEGLKSPYHQNYTIVTQEGQEQTKSGQYYNEKYGK